MSSYIIVDVDELADLLVEIWAANSRRQGGGAQRTAEELRRRKEKLDAEEQQARAAEQQLDEEYAEALRQLGASEGEVRDHAEQIRFFENRRKELCTLAKGISQEAESLGSAYLADFGNYRTDPALYREVAQLQQGILDAAAQIMREGGLVTEYDAESRFRSLEKTAKLLEDRYDQLMALFARSAVLRDEAKEKRQQFSALLAQLANGSRAAAEQVRVLPKTLPGAAAEAQVVRYALDTVRHYLLGGESALLEPSQREELRRLYGLREEGRPLADIASRSTEVLRTANEQFRAAKKRGFDRTIRENRRALAEAKERYLTMYETVHGTLEGAMDWAVPGDPAQELAACRRECGRLERRYLQIQRQRLLEDTLNRALSRSRPGMQVRQVGAADTGEGNRRMLYQIGADGTALEVYTDARGQILMEAGGIVEGRGPASEAQSETVRRNLGYFCDHQLPAILESFETELAAADLTGKVVLRREPEEDRMHLFTLDAYPDARGALIIEQDGTVRRAQEPETPELRALPEE